MKPNVDMFVVQRREGAVMLSHHSVYTCIFSTPPCTHLCPIPCILHPVATLTPYTCPYHQELLRPSARYHVQGTARRVLSSLHLPCTPQPAQHYHANQKCMRCIICIPDTALHMRITHQAPHAYTSMPVYRILVGGFAYLLKHIQACLYTEYCTICTVSSKALLGF